MAATLLDTWSDLVRQNPAHPAVIAAASGREYTRAELNELSDTWRDTHLAGMKVRGRRVAFAQPNGAEWFSVFLGLMKAGAVPVPLDFSEPPAIQQQLATAIGAAFLWNGARLESLTGTRPRREPAEICLVKLTSGSTGTPRALAFTHAEMLADGRQICASMDIRPLDLNLTVIPLGHSYGLGNLVVPLLAQGTAMVCASAPLPHALAADGARWKPTVFPVVPALLRVLTLSDVVPDSLHSLRVIVSAGASLTPEVARAFAEKFNQRVHSFYGSSETGGITYDRDGEATLTGRSVGTPLNGVTLRFGPGQRFIVESAAVFTHGNRRRADYGAFRPADRGELNSQGELTLLGRAGRMVKIAGRRLDLTELEQNLKKLPGIRDAYAAPHPVSADELAAILATDLTLEETRTLLRRDLAAWKVPRRLLVLKEFPLTARGKTDARALREKLSGDR